MSGMASNYDMPKLVAGIVVAFVAFALALPAVSAGTPGTSPTIIATMAAYLVMMFASSYVEEEQHFWYWMATAWLAIISAPALDGYAMVSPSPVYRPLLMQSG